jgi:hypothetical protein
MKRNTVLLGLLAFLLALVVVLPSCDLNKDDGDDGLEEAFSGIASYMGVTQPVTADELVAFTGQVSGWSEFILVGCELYVNGKKITSGTTYILPTDTIRILVPSDSGGGSSSNATTQLSSNATYAEAIAKLDAIIAYCDVNPNTSNTVVRSQAVSYKSSLSAYSSTWNSSGPAFVAQINTLISQLQSGGGGIGGGTLTGTWTGGLGRTVIFSSGSVSGTALQGLTSVTYTVSGTTITFFQSGSNGGTVTYAVSGSTLTFTNPTGPVGATLLTYSPFTK